MKKRIVCVISLIVCGIMLAACSKIIEPYSIDGFSDFAESEGLTTSDINNSMDNAVLAEGNGIHAEYYVFDKQSDTELGYNYMKETFLADKLDSESKKESSYEKGYHKRYITSDDENAYGLACVDNSLIYVYSLDESHISDVEKFIEKMGY